MNDAVCSPSWTASSPKFPASPQSRTMAMCVLPLVPRSAPPNSQATQQLVPQALSLGNGAQAAVGHLLGVQLHGPLGELEALLHHAGQLTNAATLHTCKGPGQLISTAAAAKVEFLPGWMVKRERRPHNGEQR